MDEGVQVMRSPLPKFIERGLALLLPPACREEVLGDLYESCDSLGAFIREALPVIPMVIGSRIRRTSDPQILIMQATALYASFVGTAWYEGKGFLFGSPALLSLAVPPVGILFGLVLDDAYATPGRRSIARHVRGPILGLGFAWLSRSALSGNYRPWALPLNVMFFGSVAGFLLVVGIRSLFPPISNRPAGVAAPAYWLRHTPAPIQIASEVFLIAKPLAVVLAIAFVGGEFGGRSAATIVILVSVALLIFRELTRSR